MNRLIGVVLLSISTIGCAFSDGNPWGEISLTLSVEHSLEPARLDDSGRWITANDYAIDVSSLTIQVDGVTVRSEAPATSNVTFDPASPPDGYSLCHGGHCHHDSGALVSYEDIAAELGGGGESTWALTFDPDGLWHPATSTLSAIQLGPCSSECQVDRISLSRVSIPSVQVRLVGLVVDRRTGDAARLPTGGIAVDATFQLPPTSAPLDLSFGSTDRYGASIDCAISVPSSLLDTVDWSRPIDDAVGDAVTTAARNFWNVTVSRYDED
ncbi:MAG: hypothetical protein ACI9OJ_000397 [Myxococcota bacterium]